MLYFPTKILTAAGREVPADSEDIRYALKSNHLVVNTPIACYPRPDYEEEMALFDALGEKVIASRQVLDMGIVGDNSRKNIRTLFPAGLAEKILDPHNDDASVKAEAIQHFKAMANTWHKTHDKQQHLMDAMTAGKDIRPHWEKVLPRWLTASLRKVPILVVPFRPDEREDWGGATAQGNNIVGIRYQKSVSPKEKALIVFEEALHVAQGQSQYWNEHEKEILDATLAFKKRISARDDTGARDNSPEAKKPRQLLKKHRGVDTGCDFWQYPKGQRAEELVVDMALIESQLLTGAHDGKPRSQATVDRIMTERFPEVYPHYKTFINECIDKAIDNKSGEKPRDELDALKKKWTERPFAAFAKKAYSADQSRQ